MRTERVDKKEDMVSLGIVKPQPLREMTCSELQMSNFNVNFFQIHSAVRLSVGGCLYYTREHTVICMYMQNVHAKYETKQKKRGKEPGCSSINTTVLNKCYVLWLEKTMLAPTCTISSLLILTITVRRTRWSVGRGVLRVVTQAYQGDEETRLTEPRYCWPTTLHSSPLTELTELYIYTQLLRLHYARRGIAAQLHLEVKTKWSVSV